MTTDGDIQRAFGGLLRLTADLPDDLEAEVAILLERGSREPMSSSEADATLRLVLARLEARAAHDDAATAVIAAAASTLRSRLSSSNGAAPTSGGAAADPAIAGITEREPVQPVPRFQGRPIPMLRYRASPRDLALWAGNDRLQIHVSQFQQTTGHPPDAEETLQIMRSESGLQGAPEGDEFSIRDLADDIAAFGLERPPILARDGRLLDGNRRIAACLMILNDSAYDQEARERVQDVEVHELSEHATEPDADWVVTTLNFRRDQKKEWRDYVKARKIYAEWDRMMRAHPGATDKKQREMRLTLAKRFQMGNRTDAVGRFLKMVEMADEFEAFMVDERGENAFEVRHRAMKHFQFFDELTKGSGKRTRGADHALRQSDRLREVVFDLLYQGKFANWTLVRDLKHAPENAEVMEELEQARDADHEKGTRMVRAALTEARQNSPETVETSSDLRIGQFVAFLEKMSITGFQHSVSTASLKKLLRALQLVEAMVTKLLDEKQRAS